MKSNVLPKTHVGINTYQGSIQTFTETINDEIQYFKERDWGHSTKMLFYDIKLKLRNKRLGCACIYLHDLNYNEKWKNEIIYFAKNCGFEKAEIADEKTLEYTEAIAQSNVKLKEDDVVWICYGNVLDIWCDKVRIVSKPWNYDIKFSKLSESKCIPKFVIYRKGYNWKDIEKTAKNLNQDCKFFEYDQQPLVTMALTYAKTMAEIKNPYYGMLDDLKEENFVNNMLERDRERKQTPPRTIPENYFIPQKITANNPLICAVGIDLGTSRYCLAVNRKNGITTIPLDNKGERLLPSYVAFDEIHIKCGQVVVDRLRFQSQSTVFDTKRIIGRPMDGIEIDSHWSFKIIKNNNKVSIETKGPDGSLIISAEEVATYLLKQMKQKAEDFQGKKLENVVITIPAAFNQAQKDATKTAAVQADWNNVKLLPEPIAAAFAYFAERDIPNNSTLLLFDLGGGTLDVCVFKIQNNEIQIISNTGDVNLGGRDFDKVLINHFLNLLSTKYGISLAKNKKFKLFQDCQKIKETLSLLERTCLDIEEYDPAQEAQEYISRWEFENMTKSLLNKIQNTVQSALFKCDLKPNQINEVLQVGGGSRMPMVKQLLKDIFPDAKHCCEEHPEEVVAIGAAYYSYSILS